MTMVVTVQREAGVEWSVVSRALPGEAVSGDQHLVRPRRDGVLLAVIDGLGHGAEATLAARKAVDTLSAHADDPVVELVQRCHQALRDTRGAAMTLVSIDHPARAASVLGVGNVEAVIVRAAPDARPGRESVLLRNGVVGYQLPALQAAVVPLRAGDVVVFATDGVKEDFGDPVSPADPLPLMLERILAQKYRGTDDALVLACKILGDHEA